MKKLNKKQLFFRLLLCLAFGGVAALIVHASVVSLAVGIGVGFFLGWLPIIGDLAPGCNTAEQQNKWCWFVVQSAVAIAVFAIMVWPRPDQGWISFPEPKEPPTSLQYDLWYAVAKFRLANVAATIFITWFLQRIPPLRQVRRWLGIT